MSQHRFFVESPLLVGEKAHLPAALAHQLQTVLRLRAGARVLLLDSTGWEYEAELTSLAARGAEARVLARKPATGEPRSQVTLYQALLRGPRFEWVLQKGTELGVAAFVPVLAARCVAAPRDKGAKLTRWQAIVREAAEQSGRGRLPRVVKPMSFAEAIADVTADVALLAWEGEKVASLRAALAELGEQKTTSWALFIGPEGGFTQEEVAIATARGIRVVGLGLRVLRAETAAIAGAAALLYALGDWEGRTTSVESGETPDN